MGAIYNRRAPSEGPGLKVLVVAAAVLGSGAGVGVTWAFKHFAPRKAPESPVAAAAPKPLIRAEPRVVVDEPPPVRDETPLPAGVPAWLETLKSSSNPTLRSRAASALGFETARAAEIRPALFAALGDRDVNVRCDALESLWTLGAFPPSKIMATFENGTFPSAFREMWSDAGEPEAEALARIVHDERSGSRLQATASLAAIGPRAAVAVASLAWAIKDDEPGVSEAAALALREIGSDARDAAPVLFEAAHSKRVCFRTAAVAALIAVDQTPVFLLVRELRCEHEDLRRWARDRLDRMGRDALPALYDGLKDAAPRIRAACAKLLGDIRERDALPRLVEAAKDADPDVQAAVRSALMLFGDVEPSLLIDVLRNGDPILTSWAVNGLDRSAASTPVLVEAAKDPRTRRLACEILIRRGAPPIDVLKAELADPEGQRLWAARTLASLGGDHVNDALAFFVDEFKSGGPRANPAAIEIRAIGAPAVTALKPLLSLRDDPLRLRVLALLADMGPTASGSLPSLIDLLTDRDPALRAAAARAIGRLGPAAADASCALYAALNDTEHAVRVAVTEALKKIQPPPSTP